VKICSVTELFSYRNRVLLECMFRWLDIVCADKKERERERESD